jgi:enamine deaminase RidA (YjgF/YER057c/UK114 family)
LLNSVSCSPPASRGDYVSDVVHRGVVYVSGQLLREDNLTITGPVTSATSQDDLKRAGCACCAH